MTTDEREQAWFAVHELLPRGWRLGSAVYDPGRRQWAVAAVGPTRRGRIPSELEGVGDDEIAAVRELARMLAARLDG